MKYEFAPLEGVTTHVQRRAHRALFTPPERYFTPFLALTQNHVFSPRELPEIAYTQLDGIPVIPQLLASNTTDFLWAADELAQRGFAQVNLNMGCPSGTVVTKGKGAGMLRDTGAMRRFLDEIYAKSPVPVSIKTRIGLADAQEFDEILDVLCDYPLPELIIHPRVREAYYTGTPDLEAFGKAIARCSMPVSYNGDLFSAADVRTFALRFPQVETVMIGRGALANPAIFGELKGGETLDREKLRAYCERLEEGYIEEMGAGNALGRLKELWTYLSSAFEGVRKQEKAIRKAKKIEEYRAAVQSMFEHAELANPACYRKEGYESIFTQMRGE